uniref:WW domain-containing protein n=1 Tax=Parastrongyloides trichosuri TaxID=131310 RepID=A0A0N4Z1T6_PARTI
MNNDGIDKASKENYRSSKKDSIKNLQGTGMVSSSTTTGAKQKIEWVEVKSKTGKFYYYNKYINKSMWEKPSVYMPYQETSKIVDQSLNQNGISNSSQHKTSKTSPKIKRFDNISTRPIFGKDTITTMTHSQNNDNLSSQQQSAKRNSSLTSKNVLENGYDSNGRKKSIDENNSINSGTPAKKFRLEDIGAICISETESSSANNTPKRSSNSKNHNFVDNQYKNGYDSRKINNSSKDINSFPETPKTPKQMPKSKDYFSSPKYSPVHRDYKKKDYISKRQRSLLRSPPRFLKSNGYSNSKYDYYNNGHTSNDNYDSDRSEDERYYNSRRDMNRSYSKHKSYSKRSRSRSIERRRRSYSSEDSYYSPRRHKSSYISKRNYRESSLTRYNNKSYKEIHVNGKYVNGKYDANKISLDISEIVQKVRDGSITKKIRSPSHEIDEYKSRYYKSLRTSKSLSKLDREEKVSDENAKDLKIKHSKSMQKMKALFQAENISDIDSPAMEEVDKNSLCTKVVGKANNHQQQIRLNDKVLTEGTLNSSEKQNIPRIQKFDKKDKEKVKGKVKEKSKNDKVVVVNDNNKNESTNNIDVKIEEDPIMKEIMKAEKRSIENFRRDFELRLCNRKSIGKLKFPQFDNKTPAFDDAMAFLNIKIPENLHDIQIMKKELSKPAMEPDNINFVNRNIVLDCKKKDNETITELYKAHLEAEVYRHKVTFQEFSADFNFYRAQVEFGREVGHVHFNGCSCPEDLKHFCIKTEDDDKYYKSIMSTFKLKSYSPDMKEQLKEKIKETCQRL